MSLSTDPEQNVFSVFCVHGQTLHSVNPTSADDTALCVFVSERVQLLQTDKEQRTEENNSLLITQEVVSTSK